MPAAAAAAPPMQPVIVNNLVDQITVVTIGN